MEMKRRVQGWWTAFKRFNCRFSGHPWPKDYEFGNPQWVICERCGDRFNTREIDEHLIDSQTL